MPNFPYKLGARPAPDDDRDFVYAAAALDTWLETLIELPPMVDNRALFKLNVFDQGQEGSCTGMGVADNLGRLKDLQLSPRWVYEGAKEIDAFDSDDGSDGRSALEIARKRGACQWQFWPYKANDKSGRMEPEATTDALLHTLLRYERLRNLKEVEHAIAVYGEALITILCHTGWKKPDARGFDAVIRYRQHQSSIEYHWTQLVGYSEAKGRFLVRNSWGTGWGDNGHAWLTFDDYADNVADAWVICG